MSKCSAHIGSGKILLMRNQVTTGHCCEFFQAFKAWYVCKYVSVQYILGEEQYFIKRCLHSLTVDFFKFFCIYIPITSVMPKTEGTKW